MTDRVKSRPVRGFSFVEFMMILSTCAILLSSVDSWLANFSTRSNVTEALTVAETAKRDIVITCAADPALREITEEFIGHDFPQSSYVKSIAVSGSCKAPQIDLQTVNTGLIVDPALVITGTIAGGIATWTCESTGLEVDKPQRCRDG